jgi:hypothetical protein
MASKNSKVIGNLFDIKDIDGEEQQQFLAEVGDLVLQGALTRFLISLNESESAALEKFVEDNSNSESFMTDIMLAYPAFEAIFNEEVEKLLDETESIIKSE